MSDILTELAKYSDEWEELIYDLKVFKPRCELLGYCPETRGCGKKGKHTTESKHADEEQKPLDFIWNGETQTKVVSRDESHIMGE